MKKIRLFFSTPILLLGLGILAFGVQALWIGYYLDDWVFLYHIYRGGYERLAAYSFGVNRPFGAWPWWVGFKLFGYSPLGWHLWSLTWRLLTVVFLWLGWKQIFPKKTLQISLASALFLVYPVFVQQTAAVTFSDHWMCFAFYALSILLMVTSFRRQRLYFPLTILALVFSGLQLFTIEYFVGLEFIRPLLLWFVFADIAQRKVRLKKVFLAEIPYAIVLAFFLAWRFLWMPTPGFDRNKPEVLFGILSNPLQTISTLSINAMQDIVEALVGTWYKTYDPATITMAPVSSLISWVVVLLAFLLAYTFFRFKAKWEEDQAVDGDPKSFYPWITLSFLVMVAGFLPAWIIGQQLVSNGNYADRYGLAAMFGASLCIVSLASFLLKQKHKIILLCLAISLATGYHFRLANEYRWSWERQSRLAWQLAWRMPELQKHTAIYGDGTLTSGSWADIAWLNFFFGVPGDEKNEDYWYFDLNKYQPENIPPPNRPISEERFELLSFQGNTSDSLVVQFKTVEGQCLWVVGMDELPNPYLNPLVKEALALSNLQRISSFTQKQSDLQKAYFPEPAHDWCYYFEKAQLAVQNKEWDKVNDLWHETSAGGYKTGVAVEYLPFLYGVTKAGNLEAALEISDRARAIDLSMQDPVCQTWKKALEDPSEAEVYSRIALRLACE